MNIYEALQVFAEAVKAKMGLMTPGEPEDQLRGPFENFMTEAGRALGGKVACKGETPLADRLGKPDYAVHVKGLLAGFVELKAPGLGANPKDFRRHNKDQWKRFRLLPNVIYCDGNEWALYRKGEVVHKLVRLSGDVTVKGRKAVSTEDARALERLLRGFLSWEPSIPIDRNGEIDLKRFADQLAPLCRMLRDDVTDALQDQKSPLVQLAQDWRQLLFPEASDERFADAYAQTVAFALLLGRSEGADPLTLDSAENALSAQHTLLSRALRLLTDPQARPVMSASVGLLLRVIALVPHRALTGAASRWLYFYEDFLEAYDPKLRKDAGAYYTPVEVVRAQIRLIDDLLVNRLRKRLGFCDPGVVTLDPAAGTGTYLLGVIEHALSKVEAEQGAGAVPGQASTLAANLYGFEFMVGPFAVAELRVSRALRDSGARMPRDGPRVYLTDTLEDPAAKAAQVPLPLKPIADQHAKALAVKKDVSVIVCLGNPPYDRHEAANENNKARTGGWVRWGDDGKGNRSIEAKIPKTVPAIFNDFVFPAGQSGLGVHIKNLYNLYVYFWRWALWKVFESAATPGPGVVSFISASSYLDGDAFVGMREHMRRLCDEIWILDLGGEGRGTRKSDNVFAIQTPVAIAVAVRSASPNQDQPARVRYARIEGSRQRKLTELERIRDFASVGWADCPHEWQAPFRPAGKGRYFEWPLLTDLMLPWQPTGVMTGRTWVIGPSTECLSARWSALLGIPARKRAGSFIDNATGRKITDHALSLYPPRRKLKPIRELPRDTPCPEVKQFGFRAFDRQWLIADGRMIDRPCPDLWRAHGPKQVYMASCVVLELGRGPAVTSTGHIPDRHYFAGRGGKDIIPLYRDSEATKPNILPGLLELLGESCGRSVTPEDFLAYVYGALAQPAFTGLYWEELETRELRVPIAKDVSLFDKVRSVGAHLLWLHTYGQRFVPTGKQPGQVPAGAAKCVKPVPEHKDGYPEAFEYSELTKTLHVGEGEFQPVSPEVFEFEVSGLKVVQSWLKYRMKKGAGRKSSPLDDIRPERWTSQFTTELLELLWVLEATVGGYPEQEKLLEAVVSGPCFRADELPPVPEEMRNPPPARRPRGSETIKGTA